MQPLMQTTVQNTTARNPAAPATSNGGRLFPALTSPGLASLLVVGLAGVGGGYWLSRHHPPAPLEASVPAQTDAPTAAAEPAAVPSEVRLSPEKLAAAHLRTEICELRDVQESRSIPGRIEYNASRLLELRAPVAGVARRVCVQPGDRVEAGTLLAVLDGPEIGTARAEIAQQEVELDLRVREYEWANQLAANLEELLQQLHAGTELPVIERNFEEKVLGEHREKILSAYSRYLLSETLVANMTSLVSQGISSSKLLKERQSVKEVAGAEFRGVGEQSLFDARQRRDRARGAAEFARKSLRVAEQRLAALAGNFVQSMEAASESLLTEIELRAPFAGTIEQRSIVQSERLTPNQLLFLLADTETLWVAAEIRESHWEALRIQPDQELHVRAPALPGHVLHCRVQYAGGSVSAQTRAVPLVATIDNAGRLLRPGMFVRVSIPTGEPQRVLAVPASALLRDDGQAFVFVQEDEQRFRRVDVEPGFETEDWVTIPSGLAAGARVVVEGTFALKSELLLEGESD